MSKCQRQSFASTVSLCYCKVQSVAFVGGGGLVFRHALWYRRVSLAMVVALIGTLVLFFGAPVPVVQASSHREAPLIANDQPADNTDTYAFVSPDKPNTVTLIGDWYPFELPSGGPTFYQFSTDVLYEIHVDNVGDARDHIVYQFRFTTLITNPNTTLYNTGQIADTTSAALLADPKLSIKQTYSVTRVDSTGSTVLATNLATPPSNVGRNSIPNYAAVANAAIANLPTGETVFAGQGADPFFTDIGALFDLLSIRKIPGNMGGGVNNFANFNLQYIAIQVPITRLTKDGSQPTDPNNGAAVIGVWATSSRQTTTIVRPLTAFVPQGAMKEHFAATHRSQTPDVDVAGVQESPFIQVSRLGHPLVNEVIIPLGMKDKFNASSPVADAQFLQYVQDPELARLLKAILGVNVPPAPRNDLVQIFLTGIPGLTQPPNVVPAEELRLNVAIPPSANPNRMGVLGGDKAGYPNGRRLNDDSTDIELQALAGVLVPGFNIAPNNQLGDGVDGPAVQPSNVFPYLALPYNGFDYRPGVPAGRP